MAICYVLVEDFDADAEITAQVTTSNGGSTRDTVRIRLANTVIRLDVTAAVDPPTRGGRMSLNLFVALVGPSGSGKGAAEAVAAEAVIF